LLYAAAVAASAVAASRRDRCRHAPLLLRLAGAAGATALAAPAPLSGGPPRALAAVNSAFGALYSCCLPAALDIDCYGDCESWATAAVGLAAAAVALLAARGPALWALAAGLLASAAGSGLGPALACFWQLLVLAAAAGAAASTTVCFFPALHVPAASTNGRPKAPSTDRWAIGVVGAPVAALDLGLSHGHYVYEAVSGRLFKSSADLPDKTPSHFWISHAHARPKFGAAAPTQITLAEADKQGFEGLCFPVDCGSGHPCLLLEPANGAVHVPDGTPQAACAAEPASSDGGGGGGSGGGVVSGCGCGCGGDAAAPACWRQLAHIDLMRMARSARVLEPMASRPVAGLCLVNPDTGEIKGADKGLPLGPCLDSTLGPALQDWRSAVAARREGGAQG
jgi:hypothetical protein